MSALRLVNICNYFPAVKLTPLSRTDHGRTGGDSVQEHARRQQRSAVVRVIHANLGSK